MTGSSATGKMALDFLVQAGATIDNLDWPSAAAPTYCKSSYMTHPAAAMMDLANAAAEAAPEPIPFSPISSHSNSSVEEEMDRVNNKPPHNGRPRSTATTGSRHHVCAKCGESFSLKVRYLHHLYAVHAIRTHETRNILPCSKCNSAFLRNTDRSKHDACVHQRLRPFRCTANNCSSSFFFAKDLSKHRSTVHLRHKPFSCHLCKKAFGKREHMTSHVKRVHEKLRPFRCDVCDISLASKYNLQGHLKTAAHAAAETLTRRGEEKRVAVSVGL